MYQKIAKTYYPLLLSKLFIVSEIFICAVAVVRFENPELNQAALSGLILPIGFLYECCIYDLLTASTALSKNLEDLKVLYKYFIYITIVTTIIGVLLFASPLTNFIIYKVFNSSQAIAELAIPALPLIIIWPWAVGYRRLLQGVFIRSGKSELVGLFSCLRVLVLILILLIINHFHASSGAYSATFALTMSVLIEALLVHLVFKKMKINKQIVEVDSPALDLYSVNRFYLPLIFSSFVHHLSLSLASWVMFNMQESLLSLSVWGSISGVVWLLSTFGHSYIDVVVYYSQQGVDKKIIDRFSYFIAALTTLIVLLILYFPPLSDLIFVKILKLSGQSLLVAKAGMLIGVILPAIRCLVSVPQGQLIASRKTSVITQGVVLNIFVLAVLLFSAAFFEVPVLGLYCYLLSVTVALILQYKFFLDRVGK